MSKIASMNMNEVGRLEVIQSLVRGEINGPIAALRLGLTPRQVRRLVERYRELGASGLISRQRGKPSNHQLRPEVAQEALKALRQTYHDFGPTLAWEKLAERHDIILSKEAVRTLMIKDGLWTTRGQRKLALHQPRLPRACFGDLVQIDGSPHKWFEERGPRCTLLVFVDDATGRILQLYFAPTESTASYFAATRRYIVQWGKPKVLYADRAAIFRSPVATEVETQFHRALGDLEIDLICAKSPEAKGRVEHMNKTLQDRLVKELRLDRISTIEQANAWCGPFIEAYNKKFAVVARSSVDLHRPAPPAAALDLILTWQDKRKVTSKLTIQHDSAVHVLHDTSAAHASVGRFAVVHKYPDDRIEIRFEGGILHSTRIPNRVKARGPIEVDSKTINDVVDTLHKMHQETKKPRARPHRKLASSKTIATGVRAAKASSG